jgi:hypothetical protein
MAAILAKLRADLLRAALTGTTGDKRNEKSPLHLATALPVDHPISA